MSLLTPEIGLLFWMVVIFSAVFFVLAKWGFPVVSRMIDERNRYIEESLDKARQAVERLEGLKAEGEKIVAEAKNREAEIILNAHSEAEDIIAEARNEAEKVGQRELELAREEILREKERAIGEIRSSVIDLSTQIASIVVRQKLETTKEQDELVDRIIDNKRV